jgi:anthranilate synthase component 2
MKVLLLDNYDSFTYNLLHLADAIAGVSVSVYRNDAIALEKVKEFDKIILSPGPGLPNEAGILVDLITTYAATKPILGVCLGHQAIGVAFGATLVNLKNVFHGVATGCNILDTNAIVLKGLGNKMTIGRYHSWIVSKENFPSELEITAEDDEGSVMALQHKQFDLSGVQFHPESVLTVNGKKVIDNFLIR